MDQRDDIKLFTFKAAAAADDVSPYSDPTGRVAHTNNNNT